MPKYQKLYSLFSQHYPKGYMSNPVEVLKPYIAGWLPVVDKLYIIDDDIRKKYDALYNRFKDNKLKDNTSIHLSSLSTLPSYKLRTYIKDNDLDIQTVRKTSPYNSLVISDSFIRENYVSKPKETHYLLPKKFVNSLNPSKNTRLEADFYIYILTESDRSKLVTNHPSIYAELQTFESFYGNYLDSGWGNKKAFDNFNYFISLLNRVDDPKLNIIFDKSINNEINNGLAVDDDLFTNLMGMLKSTDNENLRLAQEIVANCELDASKPYILFLLWKFDKFRRISNNNQNFKYCLDSLKSYQPLYGSKNNVITLEDFISKIVKFHPEYLQTMFNCLRLYINNENDNTLIKEINVN